MYFRSYSEYIFERKTKLQKYEIKHIYLPEQNICYISIDKPRLQMRDLNEGQIIVMIYGKKELNNG